MSDRARAEYERDLARYPTYHDGTPRKTWDQLPDFAQQSWEPKRKEIDA